MKRFVEKINNREKNRGFYMAVISSVALSCGGTALSQTNSVSAANVTSGSGFMVAILMDGQFRAVAGEQKSA